MNSSIAPQVTDISAEFRLGVGLGTFLGLITVGLYWAFVFTGWSRRHAGVKVAALRQHGVAAEVLAQVQRRSRRTQTLGLALKIMGIVAITTLVLAFVWEVVLRKGPFPIPEEAFWFFCWLALSTLALTWGSLASELRAILDIEGGDRLGAIDKVPWLLRGGYRIHAMVLLNIVVALGILPLIIFPPIAASAVNGYVQLQQSGRQGDPRRRHEVA
jgi:hypothetical protein